MQPQEVQGQNKMTPDEAAASLSFATNLQDQLMQHQNPIEKPQTAPGQEQPSETPKESSFDPEAFKKEIDKSVKDTVKSELSSFKEELMSVLKEDNAQDK